MKLNKKILSIFYILILLTFSFTMVFADTITPPTKTVLSDVSTCNIHGVSDFKGLVINLINCFMKPMVVILLTLAVIIFSYKILVFVQTEGVEKKQAGREFMVWGIIGIFVMISLWGLVNVLQSTFTFSDNITPRKININL